VVVLDLRAVPVMDATGLVSLESAVRRLQEAGILVVLGGVREQPRQLLERAGWVSEPRRFALCVRFEDALQLAREHVGV
jgi:SulP family sulfate permease